MPGTIFFAEKMILAFYPVKNIITYFRLIINPDGNILWV